MLVRYMFCEKRVDVGVAAEEVLVVVLAAG